MSSFNALNLTLQDEQLDAEEHSRELQIEESFKIFQKALIELKARRYDSAHVLFEELFAMDVIMPNKWGLYTYSTPTLNSLRYLAFRNRGMYYYTYLVDHESELATEDIVEYTLKVVENLVEAIQHGEADTTVIALLNQIFSSYKTKRLQRWLLEYELTRQENTWIILGRRRRGMLPQFKEILKQYDDLLKSIRAPCFIQALEPNNVRQYFDPDKIVTRPLNPILIKIKEMKTQDEQSMKELDMFDVTLKKNSWEAVAKCIKELTPHVKNSVMLTKSVDPYGEVEYSIEAVKFILSESTLLESEDEGTNEEDEKESTEKPQAIRSLKVEDSTEISVENKVERRAENPSSNKRPLDDSINSKIAPRSSKRFKDKEQEVHEDDSAKIVENFLFEISTLLSSLSMKIPYNKSTASAETLDSFDAECISSLDLVKCLKGWSSWHTDLFIQNDFKLGPSTSGRTGGIEVLQLNSLLKSNMLADSGVSVFNIQELQGNKIESFLESVNGRKMHFQEVRFRFLHALLSFNTDSHERLIVDYSWSASLSKTVEWILLGLEPSMYEFMTSNLEKYPFLALSVYEILVNRLGSTYEELEAKRVHGSKTNDLKSQRNHLGKKLIKWYSLLRKYSIFDPKWEIYLGWAHYCYLQYSCDIVDHRLLASLRDIESKLKLLKSNFFVAYPNYRHIPSLNPAAINSQIRKINIIKKISIVDASEEPRENKEIAQNVEILQNVLLRTIYPETKCSLDDQDMFTFICNSPFILKVKLWEVLLSFYVSKNDMRNILRSYFNVLTLFTQVIASSDYLSLSDKGRQQMQLTILSSVGYFTSKVIASLAGKNWKITENVTFEDLKVLTKTFFLFFPVLDFESLMRNDPSKKPFFKRAVKSSSKMKDTIANLATVFVFFFNSESSSTSSVQNSSFTTNMIWSFHSLLGAFGFCDASEGNFLKICERLLCRIADNDSLTLLKQVLWCRYHYLIAGDNFTPEQHPTKAVEMDKGNSLPLGIYLVRLLYQGKNPLLASGSKSNLKPVLDNIIETIGNPLLSGSQIIERNKYELTEYLESPITVQLFRNAFSGKYTLALTTPYDELQEFMNVGVLYVSSIQSLNLYRARKKLMQARPSELDSIISMLKNDIIYNTKRFESWYLLGKCYAYLVEDDLMWTSDKLTVIEKKNSIAMTQRQSILCFIMSLTLFFAKKIKLPEDEIIAQKACEEMGVELISAYLKPMEKLCFTWKRSETTLALGEYGDVSERRSQGTSCISDFNIEQAILLSFKTSGYFLDKNSNDDSTYNWVTYYHIGRMYFKIDRKKHCPDAFESIQKACKAAVQSSAAKDAVIEPHYSLVNMCFKSVKEGINTPKEALKLLSTDKEFFKEEEVFWKIDESLAIDYQIRVFYQKIVKLLKILIASDKKKWHHRPRYRISRILFDEFTDTDGALNEMGAMMSIKSTHKNLVNIWKPDFERPGKHFVYTNQYVIFYLDILFRKGDFNSIGLVCKKIRRFGSGMAYVNKASEHAVALYTLCARRKLHINEKEYVEQILPAINYQVFMKNSQNLLDSAKKEDYSEEIIDGIKIAYQLKKVNNGIAFDGICLSLFLKFFYMPLAASLLQEEETAKEPKQEVQRSVSFQTTDVNTSASGTSLSVQNNPKPSLPRKRVSKKDAFDKIRMLVDKLT
ncbi:hypothetical protein HG535_0H04160 [Zygotorulaspora mrakii]|uniref:Histone transcription regulator 3 homolog n=1 Tax=Zygotorulaspora mrakii TaxID=42260 RepID=A0A7H9BAN2_ZYGMR|nr:uncharacterized protein HG535_0H04160 [Zygotorulaspora mrakii]QLG75089.1 hypothetical protein HG535_0H04160 [Zygotorulaspora mrakii]